MRVLRFAVMLAVFSILAACNQQNTNQKQEKVAAKEPPAPADPDLMVIKWKDYFYGPAKTESEFLVRYIVNDIVSMIEYARTNKAPRPLNEFATVGRHKDSTPYHPIYKITISRAGNTRTGLLDLRENSIWTPDLYANLLDADWNDIRKDVAAADDSSTLLVDLLNARLPDLAQKDIAISNALKVKFRSPDRHADAALLLLTLALHERSGRFNDIRILMSRATAHLAFARGLTPAYSSNTYRVADALRCALEGNQAEAVELAKSPVFDSPAMLPWRRIILLRSTLDYRGEDGIASPSFLEESETFRARALCSSTMSAAKAMSMEQTKEPRHMALLAASLDSVGVGHIVANNVVPMHITEAHETMAAAGFPKPQETKKAELLNHYPGAFFDGPTATSGRVIGIGQFAQFFQRQLCCDLLAMYTFFEDLLGDPRAAQAVASDIHKDTNDVWLMSFVQRIIADNDADYLAASKTNFEFARAHPELVTADIWRLFSDIPPFRSTRFLPPKVPHPHANEWFRDSPIPGTAYELRVRRYFPSFTQVPPDPKKRKLAASKRAPYDPIAILTQLEANYPDTNVPLDEALKSLGDLIAYNGKGSYLILGLVAEDQRLPYLKQLAPIAPEIYSVINTRYKDKISEAEYAANAEALFKLDEYAVVTSQMTPTLVEYYLKTGGRNDKDAER